MEFKKILKLLALVSIINVSTVSAGTLNGVLEAESYTLEEPSFSNDLGDIFLGAASIPEVNVVNNNPFAVRVVISIKSLSSVSPSAKSFPVFGQSVATDVDSILIPANGLYRLSFLEGNRSEILDLNGGSSLCNSEFRRFLVNGIERFDIQDATGVGSPQTIQVENECGSVAFSISLSWGDSLVIQNQNASGYGDIRQVSPLLAYVKNNYVFMGNNSGDPINGISQLRQLLFEGDSLVESLASGQSDATLLKK
jgi:hypothetical protein